MTFKKELQAEMPTFRINYQSKELISSIQSQFFAKPSRKQTFSKNFSLYVTLFKALSPFLAKLQNLIKII